MSNINTIIKVIAIVGPMGSGKSTITTQLEKLLHVSSISTGIMIRTYATHRQLPDDRATLQSLGETLISELGEVEFCRQLLNINANDVKLIDGIRHIRIWDHVRNVATKSWLFYVDIEPKERYERLIRRGDIPAEHLIERMNHNMEREVEQLKLYADLIIGNMPVSDSVQRIMRVLKDWL